MSYFFLVLWNRNWVLIQNLHEWISRIKVTEKNFGKCSDRDIIRQFTVFECLCASRFTGFLNSQEGAQCIPWVIDKLYTECIWKISYFFIFLSLIKAISVTFEESVKTRYFKILLTFSMMIGHGDISSGKLEGSHSWRNAVFGSPWQSLM